MASCQCVSVRLSADEEGVKYHDKGKHATHEGLDKFMKHIGLWYVNTMKASDMVYTKGCGCVNAQPASQPASQP